MFFSPVKSVHGVGSRGLRGEAEFTGQRVPRRMDGSVRAGPGLGDKGKGSGVEFRWNPHGGC